MPYCIMKSRAALAPSTSKRYPLLLYAGIRPMSWNIAPRYSSSGSYFRPLRSPLRAPNRNTRREWLYSRSVSVSRTSWVAARAIALSGILMPAIVVLIFWFLSWQVGGAHECFQASTIVAEFLIPFEAIDVDIRLTARP